MNKYIFFVLFSFLTLVFFRSIFTDGKLPIPADTIVGLYHPFRDIYAQEYPRGIPFKNFLITDPVRQEYPWRNLAIEIEKKLQLPLWNPYNFAGTPLLANFQTAAFYPLNIVFFFFSFNFAWIFLIVFQPVLGGIFMYVYLRSIKLTQLASWLGATVFAFSGFSIAWLEWNTVYHVLLWLPLILLSVDKTLEKKTVKWIMVLIFAESSAILAGHLQVLFYTVVLSNVYLLSRVIQINSSRNIFNNFLKRYKPFLFLGLFVLVITAVQWVPTLQFILLSARDVDQGNWHQAGWFMPLAHLIQFVAPDFFGNPATLNYWGVWNYAEFIGYISIFPLLMSFYALFFRRDKKTLFFGLTLFLVLLFSTSNPIARIPFSLGIPFLSTSQPTRLLGIVVFALSVLSALGLDYFVKTKKNMYVPIMTLGGLFILLWAFVLGGYKEFPPVFLENVSVAKRNLILPSTIFLISSFILIVYSFLKNWRYNHILILLLILLTTYDLFRLGDKFLPFTRREYLFPITKTTEFLQKNAGIYRVMATDDRILPPNFSIMYKIQTISGYDPLYLKRYGELIAASERGNPNIAGPFGFNRIITPKSYDSKIIDLLGVKYILSLFDIKSPKLKKVFQEGETRVYENKDVMPRAFFVSEVRFAKDGQSVMNGLLAKDIDLKSIAFVEDKEYSNEGFVYKPIGIPIKAADLIEYSENRVIIKTENNGYYFLILTDTFYPTWKAQVDGKETEIVITNYNFRGILLPAGKHMVEFYNSML